MLSESARRGRKRVRPASRFGRSRYFSRARIGKSEFRAWQPLRACCEAKCDARKCALVSVKRCSQLPTYVAGGASCRLPKRAR